ncbi:MAG: helix-turn-helix transcriptional regulator [Ruminococcaceae bacterium]|nr:helix-turn-helix transcriptional regulator [Oscillospiraceae bacterium]
MATRFYRKRAKTMTIGEKIKALRQANNVTQEKLAEYLNITYQSVSKWENNNALPDISLVVPLANFFGVSIDELFDYGMQGEEAEIESYDKRDYDLAHHKTPETIRERIALWREALQKYPRNFRCLQQLAYALHDTLDRSFEEDCYQENAKEVISICERILRDCTDNAIRSSAIQILVLTYSRSYLTVADEGKAVKYAEMADSIYVCREILLEHAYYTEQGKKEAQSHKHFNNLTFMDFLTGNLICGPQRSPEDTIFAMKSAKTLWETLIYDGNFLFFHSRMGLICSILAQNYAKLENREETIHYLQEAYGHVKAFDEMPTERDVSFTSVFVCEATSARHPMDSCMESFLADLRKPCFDFLREDEAFLALMI